MKLISLIVCSGLLVVLACSSVQATTFIVPGDFGTIQGAIADAGTVNGDEIVVSPGTYFEVIDFLGKAITLRSASGEPNNTIIDGLELYHVVQCVSSEDANTVLEGFTITGGNADGTSPDDAGAGMYNFKSSPTVTNCIFTGNHAKGSGSLNKGGGMYNDSSNPNVTDCTFELNSAEGSGGGMYNGSSNPIVTDCTFSGNSVKYSTGGGMFNWQSNPTVTDCTFSVNSAPGGGGMVNSFGSNPVVTYCTFSGNTAENGGGMYTHSSNPTVTNCTFSMNTATINGGGMVNYFGSHPTVSGCTFNGNLADLAGGWMYNLLAYPRVTQCKFIGNTAVSGGGMRNESGSAPFVTNCIFSRNLVSDGKGGGMSNYNGSIPVVVNCTFSENEITDNPTSGGGMSDELTSSSLVLNTIFWGNLPDQVSYDGTSTQHITYSLVQGWTPGIGNIDSDPFFVNAAVDDLHLQASSPAIDAGSNALLGGLWDLDGNSRVIDTPGVGAHSGPIVDMGAYESGTSMCLCANGLVGDINCDGIVNLVDLRLLALHWLETI